MSLQCRCNFVLSCMLCCSCYKRLALWFFIVSLQWNCIFVTYCFALLASPWNFALYFCLCPCSAVDLELFQTILAVVSWLCSCCNSVSIRYVSPVCPCDFLHPCRKSYVKNAWLADGLAHPTVVSLENVTTLGRCYDFRPALYIGNSCIVCRFGGWRLCGKIKQLNA